MSFFSNLFKKVKNFAVPAVEVTAKELAKLALQAVLAEAPKVISGQEKFNSAASNIGKNLAESGKTAASALVSVAIEAALEGLKSKVN